MFFTPKLLVKWIVSVESLSLKKLGFTWATQSLYLGSQIMALDDIPKKISLYTKLRGNFELPWGLGIIKAFKEGKEKHYKLELFKLPFTDFF